jgi:GNAT superfamily N-acetyltransferase
LPSAVHSYLVGATEASLVHVRAFTLVDSEACCRIINACVQQMSGLNDPARMLIASKNVPSTLGSELSHLYAVVADAGNEIQGLGALDQAEIKRLYVSPSLQKHGIGTAILAALEEQARQTGVHQLELQASPSSESFYTLHGYRSIREERTTNGDAEFTHIRMEKRLA